MIPYAHCFLKTDCISRSNIRNFNRRSEIFRQTSYRICRRTDDLSASDREENLVHILLIAMIAAFMNQFAGTLQNRQVASVGFYMIYILLAALTGLRHSMWLFSGWNPGYVISLLLWECFIRFTFWQLRWRREV